MPLLWLSLAFLAGLVLAGWTHLVWSVWLGVGAAALILWRLPWRAIRRLTIRHPSLRIPLILLLAALALGGLRYELAHQPSTERDLAWHNNSGALAVTGWVADYPDRRDTVTLLRVRAESVIPPGRASAIPVRGDVLVMVSSREEFTYGERLSLTGKLIDPPEDEEFSYRDYLARQGIYSYLAYPRVMHGGSGERAGNPLLRVIFALRERAHEVVTALFPPPEAPLLDGILLGLDHGLPEEIETAFRRTGTSHIIAISGFNMAILGGLFAALFGKMFSRWLATGAALVAIACYAVMVGANAAVVRAAIMTSLSLLAVQLGRTTGGANALFFAAALMGLVNPNLPWDVSFQLSGAATLGLLLYASRVEGWLRERIMARLPRTPAGWPRTLAGWLPSVLAENVFFTLIAQAFTLPIIAWHFGRVSIIAPLANFLVLPAQSALLTFAGLATLAGTVWLPLGQALAAPAWALAAYSLRVVTWLGGRPSAEWVLAPTDKLPALLIYAAVALLIFNWKWARERIPQVSPVVVMAVLAGLTLWLWRGVLAGPDGRLHVVVANQTGGLTVLVCDPVGQALLIPGGGRASQASDFLGRWFAPFDRGVDAVLLDNPSAATLGALPDVMSRFPPGAVYTASNLPDNASGRVIKAALAERDLRPIPLEGGQTLRLAEDVSLRVLACGEDGCDYHLEMGNFSVVILSGGNGHVESSTVVIAREMEFDSQTLDGRLILSPNSISPGGWLHIQTDGERMWMEEGR